MSEEKKLVPQMGIGLDGYAKSEIFPEDSNPKEKIAELFKLMYDRNLTDASGGNMSCRVDDKIYISPRYAGEVYRLQIKPDQVLTLNLDSEVLEGDPNTLTREGSIHTNVYKRFSSVKAIIHAHTKNVILLSSLGINIPPNTTMFKHLIGPDPVDICDEVGPATDSLSETVIECFARREDRLNKYGAAVMIPNHGVIVAARNLDYAFCLLETVDTSAYIHTQKMILESIGAQK